MIASTIKMLFSRKLILPTLLIIIAMGVMARLGIWQLDRLSQRRASNTVIAAQLNAARLDLNQALEADVPVTSSALNGMQYRSVLVRGVYDFDQQVGLLNQVWSDQIGVDLLTPLHISGTDQTVLVDRGWTLLSDFKAGSLAQYNETGDVSVQGVILDSQTHPSLGRMQDPPFDPSKRTNSFYIVNTQRIGQELAYSVLPIYIQQMPDPARAGPPYRKVFSMVLSDGPHLSYAIQWFCFALILGIGYPILVRKNANKDTGTLDGGGFDQGDQRSGITGIH